MGQRRRAGPTEHDAGKATEAHQIFQSTGVEEAAAFDKPNTGEEFLLHGQSGLSHLSRIPEAKLATAVRNQLHSTTELAAVVDAAVVDAVISWARTGDSGRLPRSKMSAQSASSRRPQQASSSMPLATARFPRCQGY